MLLRFFRGLGLALGITVVLGLATQGVAAADVTERFAASSGDACGYGSTSGQLVWSSTFPAVAVKGTVVDQPSGQTFPCRDDGRITVAQFVAFTLNGVAQRHAERADNGVQSFSFRLGSNTAVAKIAYVTVQVCRYSTNVVPDYCGATQTYRNPA